MFKYKVLKDFQWGNTSLTKGKTITIEEQKDGLSLVKVDYSETSQIVDSRAVEGMVLLEKIEKL